MGRWVRVGWKRRGVLSSYNIRLNRHHAFCAVTREVATAGGKSNGSFIFFMRATVAPSLIRFPYIMIERLYQAPLLLHLYGKCDLCEIVVATTTTSR